MNKQNERRRVKTGDRETGCSAKQIKTFGYSLKFFDKVKTKRSPKTYSAS